MCLCHCDSRGVTLCVCVTGFCYCRNLVDMKATGKLNAEQFAVAMYLISEKVNIKRMHASSAWDVVLCSVCLQ